MLCYYHQITILSTTIIDIAQYHTIISVNTAIIIIKLYDHNIKMIT